MRRSPSAAELGLAISYKSNRNPNPHHHPNEKDGPGKGCDNRKDQQGLYRESGHFHKLHVRVVTMRACDIRTDEKRIETVTIYLNAVRDRNAS